VIVLIKNILFIIIGFALALLGAVTLSNCEYSIVMKNCMLGNLIISIVGYIFAIIGIVKIALNPEINSNSFH
jgi:hypothetical protein